MGGKIALGLACLIQSWAFLGLFCLYLVLIIPLISMEEDGLRNAYGEQYGAYQKKNRETHSLRVLIPAVMSHTRRTISCES